MNASDFIRPRVPARRPRRGADPVRRRIHLVGLLALGGGLAVIAQVLYLQIARHEHFTTLARGNSIKILPALPPRGLIFSNDGVLLADNQPTFTLEVVPERTGNLDTVVAQLSELVSVSPDDLQRFTELRLQARQFEGIPLRFNLDEEEVARFMVNRHLFPGVNVVTRLTRYYPLGGKMSHVIGYTGIIAENEPAQHDRINYLGATHIGKSGIEKAYEALLHGHVGYRQVEVNAQGREIRELESKPASSGKNLYLTLDASLQTLAAQTLEGKRGAIVALEANTGAVLAALSSPGYDPNLFVNGIDRQSYAALLRSRDTPLLNRFLQGKYPPGSTIKPLLSLGALRRGARAPDQQTFCRGWYSLRGSSRRYRDWKKDGHGHTDMKKAIVQSCDVYFYALAHEVGIDEVHDMLTAFGFGAPTGVDIGGEAAGLTPSTKWKKEALGERWYLGETLSAGIGQGATLATPIQLAAATAAVANGGRLLRPYLLAEARDALTGRTVIQAPDSQVNRLVPATAEQWDVIIRAMREVVHGRHGTARRAGADAAYEFAGKTGTAQVISIAQGEEYDAESIPEEFRDHALFIAFAPVEEPQIALAVVVENGGQGARAAAPIARALLDHYFAEQEAGSG